jgi:hypothetical protein
MKVDEALNPLKVAAVRNRIEVEAITMSSPNADKVFTGSIPRLYETHLVPLIFEPYAADVANSDIAAEAIAQRFGRGAVDGKIQAHIVTIEN